MAETGAIMTDDDGRGPITRLRALIHRRQMRPLETPANDMERDATPEERHKHRCRMIERYADRRNNSSHNRTVPAYGSTGFVEQGENVADDGHAMMRPSAHRTGYEVRTPAEPARNRRISMPWRPAYEERIRETCSDHATPGTRDEAGNPVRDACKWRFP